MKLGDVTCATNVTVHRAAAPVQRIVGQLFD